MSVEVRFVFVLLAVICFVLAAVWRGVPRWWAALIALGLALFTLPELWDLGEAL